MPTNTEECGQKQGLKVGLLQYYSGRMIHWDAETQHMQNLVKAALTFCISMHLNFHWNIMFTFERVELRG